jgi:hypothetical protein
MAKINVYARTDNVGSKVSREIEVPDEDLEGLEDHERAKYINEHAKDVAFELFEWGWDEIK